MPEPHLRSDPPHSPAPRILVVDDDRRVRDLLEIALTAQGFSVATAADGDEAVRRALAEPADLVVLDVRLPKKSGLEVCEVLRASAADPWVPIIMVSAAAETDARLQGFSRGADDYLGKPFSPKELIARIRRLLARAAEQRDAHLRARDLERDLVRAREEARRAQMDEHRERRLRDLASSAGRELLGLADLDLVARRLLTTAQTRLGAGTVALLVPDEGGALVPWAVRGDGYVRVARLRIPGGGPLAETLAGLARPVALAELDRLPEVRADLGPIVAARFGLAAPLRGRGGLEGTLLAEERVDGPSWDRADLESLAALCDVAAIAVGGARRELARLEAVLGTLAGPQVARSPAREAAVAMAAKIARDLALEPRWQRLVAHGVSLGPWIRGAGRATLGPLATADETGLVGALLALMAQVDRADDAAEAPSPAECRAVGIVSAVLRHAELREGGAPAEAALAEAANEPRLDPAARAALTAAAEDDRPAERRAA